MEQVFTMAALDARIQQIEVHIDQLQLHLATVSLHADRREALSRLLVLKRSLVAWQTQRILLRIRRQAAPFAGG
ncbi:hypothetical protein LRH25_12840 [Ideonella azotifigens]|uniref:50S ribosomal protein L29 n=1 Tax=Ideonella azotifigens TaxID=513160 RepID=A0ABP3V6Z6_9BURK|nr:hypothetical protein [Ideonella azotifigens]MCD2341228.1 hypothetical protein [Ideonella azotifigens]